MTQQSASSSGSDAGSVRGARSGAAASADCRASTVTDVCVGANVNAPTATISRIGTASSSRIFRNEIVTRWKGASVATLIVGGVCNAITSATVGLAPGADELVAKNR